MSATVVMRVTDPIMGPTRASVDDALAFLQTFGVLTEKVETFVRALFDHAERAGIDATIALAQSILETDYFRSERWLKYTNPAGMGATADDVRGNTFPTPVHAARAQLSHLLLYATGKIDGIFSTADDPRYDAYLGEFGQTVQATTIEGLNGKWAIDKDNNYHGKIVSRGNRVFPTLTLPSDEEPSDDETPVNETPDGNTSDDSPNDNTDPFGVFGELVTYVDDQYSALVGLHSGAVLSERMMMASDVLNIATALYVELLARDLVPVPEL